MGPQMLEDVEEPMPARPATLRDPGTPDQIVMTAQSDTLSSQPWCKMCVEPQDMIHHIENSRKSTQLCLNFSSTTGTWVTEALCRSRASSWEQSILLRHMDDVVGTGPDEHLMSDFEHMKTSLYLTDVVVLRHEGDTVNFLGLEITKTSKGFEVKNKTDLVEFLLNLYGLENSKPTANPGRRSTVVELAPATPLDGQEFSNFRAAVRHAICHPTTIHTSPQPHDREQARSETVDTIPQMHATHMSSS